MRRRNTARGIFLAGMVFLFLSLASPFAFARELKLVFTGQAYAMLYPCSCPYETDGGIARRATFIKNVRLACDSVLVVETGFSFASGRDDTYAQNFDMDSRRTDIYLKSLKTMGYDAILVSSQEYVFGADFLNRYTEMPFISSNLKDFLTPDIIKDFGWIKIGILGLTDELAVSKGAKGWEAPQNILDKKIADLKKRGAQIIILLSALKPQEDQELLKNIKGIDVVINGSQSLGAVSLMDLNGITYLTTWWQARKGSVLTLDITDSKITNRGLESSRLSDELLDDEAISAFLPKCFRDWDCQKIPGSIPKCENASTMEARCTYVTPSKVLLSVIKPTVCQTCRIEGVIEGFKKTLGELDVKYLSEDNAKALELIKEFKVTMLPAYFFPKDFEKSEFFLNFSPSLEKGSDFYLFKPSYSGVSYLIGRKRIPKRIDVFFNFEYNQLAELFKLLKAFADKHKDIVVHINFLAVRDKKGAVLARGGMSEIEEFNRAACIDELYPKRTWDYLICRSMQKESSWWDECAVQSKISASKVKQCVRSKRGNKAFIDRIELTEQLEIGTGPTFVLENKEIFAIVNVPSFEEFEKMVIANAPEAQTEKKQESKK